MQKKTLWFKAKSYGWGWTPVTWQGWAIVFFYILLLTLNFFRVDAQSHSVSDTLMSFLPETLLLTIVLVAVSYATGEKPEWRWGDKKIDKKKQPQNRKGTHV